MTNDKLDLLLEKKCISRRVTFTDRNSKTYKEIKKQIGTGPMDGRDFINKFYSFELDNHHYVVNREIAVKLENIYQFFLNWKTAYSMNLFKRRLKEKINLLPDSNVFLRDFYNDLLIEEVKSVKSFIGASNSLNTLESHKSTWLQTLLSYKPIELIFCLVEECASASKDIEETIFHADFSPDSFKSDWLRYSKRIDDLFNEPGFRSISTFYFTKGMKRIYDCELFANRIAYLKKIIETCNVGEVSFQKDDELIKSKSEKPTIEEIQKAAIAMLVYYRNIMRAEDDGYLEKILSELNMHKNDIYKKKVRNLCATFNDPDSILRVGGSVTSTKTRINQIKSIVPYLKDYPEGERKALKHIKILEGELAKILDPTKKDVLFGYK